MLVQGTTDYRKESKEAVMLEMVPDLEVIRAEKSPRILNTHFPFRYLPKKHRENGGKIVHVRRNPKDVYVSLYYFLKSFGALKKEGGEDMKWEEFFNLAINGHSKSYIHLRVI